MRLKSRTQSIPNGFGYVQASTGWDAAKLFPQRSFDTIVQALIAHRKGNKFQTQGSPTDYESVANEVDAYNAKRLSQNSAYMHFLIEDAPTSFLTPPQFQPRQNVGAGVVGSAVRKTVAGVGVLKSWLGQGLKPVPKPLAEKRAQICAACEKNGQPGWLQKLTGAVASEIRTLISIKEDLALETSVDSKLNMCTVCDCKLILKVHTPLEHILKETDEKTMAELRQVKDCWIWNEKP
jgi:hypothetical protein